MEFLIKAGVVREGEEQEEEDGRGRMVFPGELSLVQAVSKEAPGTVLLGENMTSTLTVGVTVGLSTELYLSTGDGAPLVPPGLSPPPGGVRHPRPWGGPPPHQALPFGVLLTPSGHRASILLSARGELPFPPLLTLCLGLVDHLLPAAHLPLLHHLLARIFPPPGPTVRASDGQHPP